MNCPFSEEDILEAESLSGKERLYVSLMTHAPIQEKIDCLKLYENENESYQVVGREVYLLFKDSIRNSKIANNLNRLDVQSTVRNGKTLNKLIELTREMQS